MNQEVKAFSLPWQWKSGLHGKNDREWLQSIMDNAAPFSDWWTKAKIVQLAYGLPPEEAHEEEIAKLLQPPYSEEEIAKYFQLKSNSADYKYFTKAVDRNFVSDTLKKWKSQNFTQAIGRNFEIYADTKYDNVFLVTSTANVSLGVARYLPTKLRQSRFRPLFNVDELVQIICTGNFEYLTLRTHGYANEARGFYQGFIEEAEALNHQDKQAEKKHLYIGYQWPSEAPFISPSLYLDFRKNWDKVGKFLLVLTAASAIAGTFFTLALQWLGFPILNGLGKLLNLISNNFPIGVNPTVQFSSIITFTFIFWLLAFLLLRLLVYQRDRYRAIHYGSPDLAEFFWRLDNALSKKGNVPAKPDRSKPIKVNLVGHSMGCLVLVNALRILSDKFGKDDLEVIQPDFKQVSYTLQVNDKVDSKSEDSSLFGEHFDLVKLILFSPDIPLEMLREGRNNYVRSAIRRCDQIFLMSSDRDIVLRYLSAIINWFTEPSIEMSGMRLGNVYLQPEKKPDKNSNANRQAIGYNDRKSIEHYPWFRVIFTSEPAVKPTSSYELFRKFNYLDCSEMKVNSGWGGVNGVSWKMNSYNALVIDLLNTIFFIFQGFTKIDVHGGYFQIHTPSFAILKFLITSDRSQQEINEKIKEMITDTGIRFLPSQNWVMPQEEKGGMGEERG